MKPHKGHWEVGLLLLGSASPGATTELSDNWYAGKSEQASGTPHLFSVPYTWSAVSPDQLTPPISHIPFYFSSQLWSLQKKNLYPY